MKRYRFVLVALWLLTAAFLTLTPERVSEGSMESSLCLVCGARGVADLMVNVLFFLPLGFGLAAFGRPMVAVLLVVLASGGIEAAQVGIPGRFSTLGDLLANTSGGLLGLVLARRWGVVRRQIERPSAVARAFVALGVIFVLIAPALFLAPRYPEARYYIQWTADLGHLDRYEGELLSATMNGTLMPPGRAEPEGWVRSGLTAEESLHVRFRAGPPPEGLAPVLSVYDERQREAFLLGVKGTSLVVRRAPLASTVGLDRPEQVWPDALGGVKPGDTVTVNIDRRSNPNCVTLNMDRHCAPGPGSESAWALLYFPEGFGGWPRAGVGFMWVAVIGVPFGLILRGRPTAVLGGVGLILVGVVTGWAAPYLAVNPLPLLGAPVGTWTGHLVARRMRGAGR